MTIFSKQLAPVLLSGLFAATIPAFADVEQINDAAAGTGLFMVSDVPVEALPDESAFATDEPVVDLAFAGGAPRCPAQPIELTDAQAEKIHSLREQFLDVCGPKMLEVRSKQRKLRDVLMSADIDQQQAKNLQSEINSLKDDLNNLKLENRLSYLSVLTPEQRKEIRSRMLRFPCGMEGGRHGHHHEMMKKAMSDQQ
jgi:Spy/CpxP family protein refolding chaperone